MSRLCNIRSKLISKIFIEKKVEDVENHNNKENLINFAFCKEVFEKFGERRLISRGEYFAHSGEVMEYAGSIVSGGFKYSIMSSDGNDKVIGFSLDDSYLIDLIDYESGMHSTKMRTDIIALEDSEVIVIPAKIMREKLNGNHELNMNLMMGLFEQLYDQFLEFCSNAPAQRYLQLLDRYSRITEFASYGDLASYLNISRRQLQRIREDYKYKIRNRLKIK